jgi:hypothetical protein
VQSPLEISQYLNALSQADFGPRWLRLTRTRNRGFDFMLTGTVEFAQYFPSRRVHRSDLPRRDL